jgi:hypothetical protein
MSKIFNFLRFDDGNAQVRNAVGWHRHGEEAGGGYLHGDVGLLKDGGRGEVTRGWRGRQQRARHRARARERGWSQLHFGIQDVRGLVCEHGEGRLPGCRYGCNEARLASVISIAPSRTPAQAETSCSGRHVRTGAMHLRHARLPGCRRQR